MHTAKSFFAECQKKTLGKDVFCRVPKNSTRQNTSLPSARKKALDKDAFCRVPKNGTPKHIFAECQKFGTQQRRALPSAGFAECGTRQTASLPSARVSTLGKAPSTRPKSASSVVIVMSLSVMKCSLHGKMKVFVLGTRIRRSRGVPNAY